MAYGRDFFEEVVLYLFLYNSFKFTKHFVQLATFILMLHTDTLSLIL